VCVFIPEAYHLRYFSDRLLVHSSEKSLPAIAKDLGVSDPTLRNWVRHAEIDTGMRAGLTSNEREELVRLRREVRILKHEREILKKAAAFFAKESDAIR
jgi:transposase